MKCLSDCFALKRSDELPGLLTHAKSFCPLHKSSATGVARPLECLVMFHIFNADGGTVISLGLASFKIVDP